MTSLLLRGGHVYAAQDPFATAMLVADGRIAWIGDDEGASVYSADAESVIDLRGAFVAPAFVDAHVHLTSTGLTLTGLDLSGVVSAGDALARIASAAQATSGVLIGHGWDESAWPEGRPPSREELDACVGDTAVYLSRVDVHSALASSALRALAPTARSQDGWSEEGPLARAAHHLVRDAAFSAITDEQRRSAQRAALATAASRGIASVHENAGPTISSELDLRDALQLGAEPDMPEVIGYWGSLGAVELARDLGARGAAGDLFVDGSIGSHTACLTRPYSDLDPPSLGAAYLTADEVAGHVVEATRAGIQAGFHVIGDGASHIVMSGLSQACDALGAAALRSARHRLEHLEMPSASHLATLADLGVVASVQPAFDAAWGGDSGMYATRLGVERARQLNPFAPMLRGGVVLAFGSDAPVTPLDPWGSVRAASRHTQPGHSISSRAAFAAHTRGGRRAARDEGVQPGVLIVGAPATFAVWAPGPLTVQAPDGRVSAWSTDPRSGTPPLPDLDAGQPVCWRTVRDGVMIYDSGDLP
ncbi:MAG: amidohydrolase [Candidatus Nanopelagicales bacterium]